MSKRASYREAVAWIAVNDGAADSDAFDVEEVYGLVTVCLVADVWGKNQKDVGRDVVAYRVKARDADRSIVNGVCCGCAKPEHDDCGVPGTFPVPGCRCCADTASRARS